MAEVALVDAVFGAVIIAFDGRVLERFTPGTGGEGIRYHVRQLRVTVNPPNRKGLIEVAVDLVGGRGGFALTLPADELAKLDPVLDELRAAGATAP